MNVCVCVRNVLVKRAELFADFQKGGGTRFVYMFLFYFNTTKLQSSSIIKLPQTHSRTFLVENQRADSVPFCGSASSSCFCKDQS